MQTKAQLKKMNGLITNSINQKPPRYNSWGYENKIVTIFNSENQIFLSLKDPDKLLDENVPS